MSRPKPKVILEYIDRKTYKADQILEAEAVYAIFYEGRPINLRTSNTISDYPGPKYVRVSYSNLGHAFNLMDKLNKTFKTDKFEVYKLTGGVPVNREAGE